ncbi:MAG: carbohydrate ABC transporter substrate-binding protein [Bacillaceae bacterium]|nr:carbohydrate ABC transporter substrate-binding protein [Bacillaceae bacterium]
MRKLSLILLLSFVLILVTACSDTEANGEGSSSDKIKLDMWVFGSTGYEKLADEYMKEHPNVEIKIQSTQFDDHHNALFTALSAGSGAPDIAMIEVNNIERFRQAQDRFHNLYDLGAEEVKDDYLDWKWRLGENADGTFLYGLPTDIGPTAMFYRVDVFKEAGLPTDPESVKKLIPDWDAYAEVARIIKEKTGKPIADNYELIYNALRDQAPVQYFNNEDELIIEKEPYIKAAYDYTVDLIQKGYVGDNGLWTPEWGAAMDKGSYATLLAPAWMQGVVKGNAPNSSGKWMITGMPGGAGNWGGSYLTIPKETKHPEEAYKFIQWLVAPEQQLKSFKEMGLFPSTPSIYNDPSFKDYSDDYFGGINTAQVFAQSAQMVQTVYMGKNYKVVQAEIVNALTNVSKKSADPEKEWKAAVKRIKRQLERQ